MMFTFKRSLLLGTLLLCGTAYAQDYDYFNDANQQADGPVYEGNFPKIVASETQSDKGTGEQWSKYDVIGAKSGMMYKVAAAQQINPDVEFHYSFHPRAYLGYLSNDPCNIAYGMPFNSTAEATGGCSVYAGHWLYRAGTKLATGINNTTLTLRVADATRITPGSYVVIYDSPAGSFNNAEHARVASVNTGTNPHTVTLANRGFKSTPRAHGVNSIVAEHEQGSGGSTLNWAYNITTTAPRDANNKSIAQIMVDFIQKNMNRNSKGQVQNVNVTGIYFDEDGYIMPTYDADADNNLVVDNGILPNGTNVWGDGLDDFYALLRARLPSKRIVAGWRQSRGFASLNGTQMENWLLSGNEFAVNPDYTGRFGMYSQLHNYMIHLAFHQTAEGYTEALSKQPTKLYPGTVKSGSNPPVPSSNAGFRLGFGAALLGTGHYGRQNSNHHPDPWYDEYAVDVTPGSSTYGHAIASNINDESAIRAHKGWLGKPLWQRKRIYDEQQFSPQRNLISNGSFESGTAGWMLKNINVQTDTNAKQHGEQSLKVNGHQSYSLNVSGASLRGPSFDMVKGKTYTIAFAAKAKEMREILIQLDWSDQQGIYLVPEKWSRFVFTMKAGSSGSFRPIISLGREETEIWFDDFYVFEGDPNVFRRNFENGIVIVNATPDTQTVDLEGKFYRIKGTGQDPVNNGAEVREVTLPPFDAAILVRPDPSDAPEPSPAPEPPPPAPGPSAGNVTVGGQAWTDADGDGIQDPDENPYDGMPVRLLDCSDNVLDSAVTSGGGFYEFAGIAPGGYVISVTKPGGTEFSPPLVGDRGDLDSNIKLDPGKTACMTLVDGNRRMAVDIGLVPGSGGSGLDKPATASIGDWIWYDTNGNGIQDSGESGASGAGVALLDCNGALIEYAAADADGKYNFNVPAGSYKLSFGLLPGMTFSPSLQGSSRAKDSNVNPSGITGCMTINDGDTRQWFDVGLVPSL